MAFLGRMLASGSRFLGRGMSTAAYLGRTAAPMIQRGLPMLAKGAEAVGTAASNPYLQHLGQKIGVNPKTFGSIQQGAATVGAGLGMLPQVASNVGQAARGIHGAVQPVKKSLAELHGLAKGFR